MAITQAVAMKKKARKTPADRSTVLPPPAPRTVALSPPTGHLNGLTPSIHASS